MDKGQAKRVFFAQGQTDNKNTIFLNFRDKRGGYQTHNFEHFAHLIIIWGRDEKHSNDVFSTVFVDKKLGKPTLKVSENVQNYYFFLM